MSILIKELHLPAERLYPLHLTIYSDGSVFCGHGIGKRSYEAIEVPVPHGRLVDADALEDDDPNVCNSFMRDGYVESCEWGYSHEQIKSAPTIIPAEEETL